jgi:hypothetical protein
VKSMLAACAVLLLSVVGCSSKEHKAEKIETKIENQAAIDSAENVGVNKDGNMIVQKKVAMNEELRRMQNEVYSLEDRVYGNRKYNSDGLYGALKACRAKVSSKDMGGNGKVQFTEKAERITDKEDTWSVGLDDKKKIVGVSEEFLKDRLVRFKEHKDLLMKREDEYKEKLEICDAELAEREHQLKEKKEAAREAKAAARAAKTAKTTPVEETTEEETVAE